MSERLPDPGSRPPPAPAAPSPDQPAGGLQRLDLGTSRGGLLYVPPAYQPGRPAPMAVMFHGAGGDARGGLEPFLRLADAHGLILVAPASRGPTWDMLVGEYGQDLKSIERAMEQTFSRYQVDRSRLAIAGFSDGASYALGVGLASGDRFTHVVAFSPGSIPSNTRVGRPRIFLTHGVHDRVLPIASTSHRILREVRSDGYDVVYREFDDGHTVPPELADEAVRWFLGSPR